jgi:hypothetical protein
MERVMVGLATQTSAPELAGMAHLWLRWRQRLDDARGSEAGMTTETVIITAGLSALAVAVVAVIASRVNRRARSIQ